MSQRQVFVFRGGCDLKRYLVELFRILIASRENSQGIGVQRQKFPITSSVSLPVDQERRILSVVFMVSSSGSDFCFCTYCSVEVLTPVKVVRNY